jgi:hypothetical protein
MVTDTAQQKVACSSGPTFSITYEMARRLLDPKSKESQAKERLSAAVERAFRIGKEQHISEANYIAFL